MPDRISFYRSPVDRELLRELNRRSDARGLSRSLGILAVYTATTVLSLFFFLRQMWLPMALAAYIHALFASFTGMESSVHELSHKTPFRTKWLNELFYGLFCMLSWNNPVHFRESHRRHHQFTMQKGLDMEVIIEPAPWGWKDYLQWFTFDFTLFRMIMGGNLRLAAGRDVPDIFSWNPLFDKDDPRRRKMFLWARIQLLVHLAATVVFAWSGLYILIFTFSFSYFFVTAAGHSTGITQHVGMRSDVPDWRLNCHTMIFGPVMSFFYWNMNYHIEHHTYAAVPFYNLKRLHQAIAADCPVPVRGYWRGLGLILEIMRRQRKDPSWWYEAELPDGAAPYRVG